MGSFVTVAATAIATIAVAPMAVAVVIVAAVEVGAAAVTVTIVPTAAVAIVAVEELASPVPPPRPLSRHPAPLLNACNKVLLNAVAEILLREAYVVAFLTPGQANAIAAMPSS